MKKKLIIVGLILTMIIGVGIYSYFSTKGEKNDVQQPVVIEDTSDSNNADETTSNGINVVVGTIEEDTNSSNNDVTENKETSNNNSGISFSIVKETTSKENKVKIKTTTKKTKVTRKKIKVKVKKRKITTYPSTNTKPIYNPTPTKKKATVTKPKQKVKTITKPKRTKPKRTKPATKPLGTYYESNSLSSGKVSTIKNSIISKMSGSQNSEKMSLARYMSARGLSNGTSTYKSLTNGNKTFSTRVASKNIESDSNKNIIKAASTLAKSAGGSGSYGIGISSFRNKVGYRIYVVIIH